MHGYIYVFSNNRREARTVWCPSYKNYTSWLLSPYGPYALLCALTPLAAQARSPAEATGSEKPACYVARWAAWPACVTAPAAHQPACGICGRGQHDVIKQGNSSDGWELLQDYTNGEIKQLHKTVWRSYGRDRWITEAFQSESSSTSNMSDTINANDRFFCRRLYIVASVPSTQTKLSDTSAEERIHACTFSYSSARWTARPWNEDLIQSD
jgi:hypothetical protein